MSGKEFIGCYCSEEEANKIRDWANWRLGVRCWASNPKGVYRLSSGVIEAVESGSCLKSGSAKEVSLEDFKKEIGMPAKIEFTEDELQIIFELVSHVGGHPTNSPRRFTQSIYNKMYPHYKVKYRDLLDEKQSTLYYNNFRESINVDGHKVVVTNRDIRFMEDGTVVDKEYIRQLYKMAMSQVNLPHNAVITMENFYHHNDLFISFGHIECGCKKICRQAFINFYETHIMEK